VLDLGKRRHQLDGRRLQTTMGDAADADAVEGRGADAMIGSLPTT